MGLIVCLVGAAGALLSMLMIVILCLMGKKAHVPLGLFALCVVVMLASGQLPDKTSKSNTSIGHPAAQSNLQQDENHTKDGDFEKSEDPAGSGESEVLEPERGEPQTGAALVNGLAYEITYKNSKIYTNSLGETACYALVEIKNTGNVDLYLDDAVFDFEDNSGSLLATCSSIISADPDIIAPGEKGYFYCNMETLGGNISESTEYIFRPNLKVVESKNDIIRYDISDLSASEGRYGSPIEIIGRITNNTKEDDSLVWISFILYDKSNTPIGAYGTNIMELEAGSSTSFSGDASFLSSAGIQFDDIADYKVYACKTQYQF